MVALHGRGQYDAVHGVPIRVEDTDSISNISSSFCFEVPHPRTSKNWA